METKADSETLVFVVSTFENYTLDAQKCCCHRFRNNQTDSVPENALHSDAAETFWYVLLLLRHKSCVSIKGAVNLINILKKTFMLLYCNYFKISYLKLSFPLTGLSL